MLNTWLLAVSTSVPTTLNWSIKVAAVMIICNIIAIAIGKYTIQQPNSGPSLPSPAMFGDMGLPALLGTTSLGHIIGVAVILGLANLGAL
jgi:photosystem I subunit 10